MKKAPSIILLLVVLMSCNHGVETDNNRLITPDRIGNIKIGEKYNVLSDMPGIKIREVDLSGERVKNNIKVWYGYEKDNFQIYAQRQKSGVIDFVDMIICKSEEYQTQNGIHVGMTIQELRKIYPNKSNELKGGINSEIGYFMPNDLVLRNRYEMPMSHVIFELSTQMTTDTIITSIIVGTD